MGWGVPAGPVLPHRLLTLVLSLPQGALLKGKRCVVLADGFYEWQQQSGGKQPYFIYFPQTKDAVVQSPLPCLNAPPQLPWGKPLPFPPAVPSCRGLCFPAGLCSVAGSELCCPLWPVVPAAAVPYCKQRCSVPAATLTAPRIPDICMGG